MLFRKIESAINEFYTSGTDKILIVAGARQVGKSFIVRHTLKKIFANFAEINLIDDYITSSSLPIEVKSGKDYTIHSALNRLIENPDYRVDRGIVLSNHHEVTSKGEITYMPIYYVMGFGSLNGEANQLI